MAKRIDLNHRQIVAALRAIPGVTCYSTADLGQGFPDLCVGYRCFNILCEIKGPKGRLTPAQTEWHFGWTGAPVVILRTVDDVELLFRTLETYGGTQACIRLKRRQEEHDQHYRRARIEHDRRYLDDYPDLKS